MITNTPVLALATWSIVLIVILVVLVAALIGLYFFGRKAEKKQAEQQKTMEANAQTINAFVIDKKEAGLPSIVLEQSPKYARISKVPIVKVKAGPRVMNLIADPKVYEQILPKQDIKATVSGLYITSFKRIRGPIYEPPKKKKRFGRK